MKKSNPINNPGFTIVELLIVIVIIGILAAITLVSYTGISKKANEATLSSDLANAKKQLAMYNVENNSYPTVIANNCPTAPKDDSRYCLRPSSGTVFEYYPNNGVSFSLKATKGSFISFITNNLSPISLSDNPTNCPIGFILVPGSATYGTANFCVMKYEARNAGSNVPVSTATGTPWVGVSQNDAISHSRNVLDCENCHLISEAEWMTLSQNVLGVDSNWSGGAVGSGYIFSGNNDGNPGIALAADTVDANGYSGTLNSSGDATITNTMVGNTQRRTLRLSNGSTIWDMSGNVNEWTSGQVSSAIQPGVMSNPYSVWLEYPAITTTGSLLTNVTPTSTGISGAEFWTTANGIGKLRSNPVDTALHGFVRSGAYGGTIAAGVLCLNLFNEPSSVPTGVGFRVAAPAF